MHAARVPMAVKIPFAIARSDDFDIGAMLDQTLNDGMATGGVSEAKPIDQKQSAHAPTPLTQVRTSTAVALYGPAAATSSTRQPLLRTRLSRIERSNNPMSMPWPA